jgi:hypothetical protein
MQSSRPIIMSLALLSFISVASAAYFQLSGSFGSAQIRGAFHTDNSGNAGITSFDRSAGLDNTSLVGDFTVETI